MHKHFIEVIARWAAQKGYQISKEHKIPNGWVDLHLERDGVLTAVELSVTSTVEREMNNLLKCLREAYYRVVMLFLDDSLLQNFHDLIASKLNKEELDRVRVGSLNEFHRLI